MDSFDEIHDESFEIKKYLFLVIRNWYLFILFTLISLSVAYYVNKFTTPVYNVKSTILIDSDNSKGGTEKFISGISIFADKKNIDNEIGILHSYSLTRKVIDELDFDVSYFETAALKSKELYQSCPFVVNLDTNHVQIYGHQFNLRFLSKNKVHIETYEVYLDNEELFDFNQDFNIGDKISNDNISFTIEYRKGFENEIENLLGKSYYFIINDKNSLTNKYKGGLKVELLNKESSILVLSTKGNVPLKEVNYLNKLGEVYIRTELEEKNQTAVNTMHFIDRQLAEILDSLNIAEDNLQNFLLRNRIVNLSQEGTVYLEKYEKYQSEKAKAEVKLDYYNYLLSYIKSKNEFKDIIAPATMGIDDAMLNSTIAYLSELSHERSSMLYSATDDNPALNIIEEKIQNTRKALIENVNNIINNSKITIDNINKRIEKVNREIGKLPITERELLSIKRNFNLSNNIYNYLLEKRAEAGIAKASNISDNRILDEARITNVEQVAPQKSKNYSIAFILGLLIPLILLITKDYLNNTIVSRKDIEGKTKVDIVGNIGNNTVNSQIPVYTNPRSSISESFRSLRTNLKFFDVNQSSHIIAVTSAVSGEGKTFCSLNLAAIIAMSNKKVALIGLDLRKPKLHTVFKHIDNKIGLSTYLSNRNSISDILFKTHIENLSFIPSGPIPPNPAELIDSVQMEELVAYLKKEFDYVVFDTPPIALVTDSLLIAKYSDINLIVVRQNFTKKELLSLIEEHYNKKSFHNMGIVINDIKLSSSYAYSTYSSYLEYGYGYGYGYGYYEEDAKQIHFLKRIRNLFKS